MRLTLHTFLTLDGVLQAPGGPDEDRDGGFEHGGWSYPYGDDDFGTAVMGWFENADAFLLGRKTYDIFSGHWPKVTDADDPVASKLNALPKYVASTSLSGPLDWNATLIEGDVAEAVRRLRDQYASIISHGYGQLAATLVDAGLVDEIHAGIHPFMVGNAEIRLRTPHPVGLQLLEVHRYDSGIIAAKYAPVR